MMATSTKYILLLFILSLSYIPVSRQEIGCFVEGTCVDGIVIDYAPDVVNSNDCLVLCKNDTECTHFTYQTTTTFCFKFSSCPELSVEACPDCVSGHADCPSSSCFMVGRCEGVGVGFSIETSKEDCRRACLGNDGCNYFTYETGADSCLLTRNCTLDFSCDTCLYGERNCGTEELSKILIVSGWSSGAPIADSEIIDMSSTVQDCAKPADYPVPSDGPKAARIDGKPTVCGGSYSNSCYVFNGTDNTWVETSSMLQGRYHYAATMINGGTAWWITGGWTSDYVYTDSTEIISDWVFVSGPDLPEPVRSHCLVTINNTHVFLAGGILESTNASSDHVFIINMEEGDSWQRIPNMSSAREAPACNLIHTEEFGAEIVVTGGQSPTSEIYTLSSNTWRLGPNFHETIGYHVTVSYRDGFLSLGGRVVGVGVERDYIYFFDTKTWSWVLQSQTLVTPRCAFAVILLEDDEVHC